ncbi:MAG TPA: lipid A deacylase LpxR family protein [Candidatus Polarisedimenticolia bacterium]|nr:lipid A deacylase LpxR family protein [Candidatus Polarisedimenticolia bacterium]
MPIEPFAHSRRCRPRLAAVLLLISIGAWGPLHGESEPAAADYAGILSFYHENDIYLSDDSNYTSGFGFTWVSNDEATYRERNLVRRMVRGGAFLPSVGDAGFRSYVSFNIGQEIYTPEDITAVPPPPDQQPYAGVLFFDTAVYGHSSHEMDAYTLRIGCVGPCSGAEQTQKAIHERVGSPIPQGWEYQLVNEFIINLDYQHYQRVKRKAERGSVQYDITWRGGGGFGNYYIGANLGIEVRVGYGLPDSYGVSGRRSSGASSFVGAVPPPRRVWWGFAFAGLQGFAVGRFLPTDGNTFQDSPSVERDDFTGNLTTGFVVGYRRFVLSWTLNNVSGLSALSNSSDDDFGALTFSFYFPKR